jgi:hypothetical protein
MVVIRFDPAGSPKNLHEMILRASSLPGASGLMILACDANGFTPASINPILSRAPIPVFGGGLSRPRNCKIWGRIP